MHLPGVKLPLTFTGKSSYKCRPEQVPSNVEIVARLHTTQVRNGTNSTHELGAIFCALGMTVQSRHALHRN